MPCIENRTLRQKWKTQHRLRDTLERYGVTGAGPFKTGGFTSTSKVWFFRIAASYCVARRYQCIANSGTSRRPVCDLQGSGVALVWPCHARHRSRRSSDARNVSGKLWPRFSACRGGQGASGKSIVEEHLLNGFDAVIGSTLNLSLVQRA